VADQIDAAVHEDPPEIGGLTLSKQLLARDEPHLSAHRDQLEQLVVVHALEQAERAKIVDVHHIVAR
jgi:hypothetical protein